jgi:plasmid stabilization system protein ParE
MRSARTDLENIYTFIKLKNEKAAINIHDSILDEVGFLKSFPQIAPIEQAFTDLPKTYRSLVVKNTYKVVYYVEDEIIYIIAVWDCRQNPNKLKKKLKK